MTTEITFNPDIKDLTRDIQKRGDRLLLTFGHAEVTEQRLISKGVLHDETEAVGSRIAIALSEGVFKLIEIQELNNEYQSRLEGVSSIPIEHWGGEQRLEDVIATLGLQATFYGMEHRAAFLK